MSDKQLIDNSVTFIAAGHETTAKALTWTLYLIARAPEWQHRIRREVKEVAGDATIASEHIDRLIVTRAVLEEAMRLYPPAPVMTRQVAGTVSLGGEAIPDRALIFIPISRCTDTSGCGTTPTASIPSASCPSARPSIRAPSSCRSASGRAPASAPRLR
jgi:hypothetical protein